jgi:hypothetical protein
VAAISEFDQVLYEDENTNRMDEALDLFEEICGSRWFRETSILLFLNKSDLFAEKLKTVPLTTCFPEYEGDNDFDSCCTYVTEKFLERNHSESKVIYTHVTNATDKDNVKHVFNAVKDTVIRSGMISSGLL